MYRVKIARSGYYYAQKKYLTGWSRIGGFSPTLRGAERTIEDAKYGCCKPRCCEERVVAYY